MRRRRTAVACTVGAEAASRSRRNGPAVKRGGPLRRQSKRAAERGTDDIPAPVRAVVLQRARYRCEAQIDPRCDVDYGLELHHRLRRSQGGEHTAANLVAVCRPCHRTIHSHVAASFEAGLLIHQYDGAPTTAWTPPSGGLPSAR